ncbi:MAG: hypothetical protein JST39_13040, partial [Bacteroidetes bacterium]|nr:hypothetical protein [Bacteroidota bacterium]
MLQELIELEEQFQPHLLPGAYTFIGPSNPELFQPFMARANDLAPVVAMIREIRHFMGNKQATRAALTTLPQCTTLRIYVIPNAHGQMLIHTTIEQYCNDNNINFNL